MKKIINNFASIIILIIAWFILTLFYDSLFLPSLTELISAFFNLLTQAKTFLHIGATLGRMFLGLFTAIFIGVPLGLILGYYFKVYAFFEFLIDFLRSIPPPVLLPLFMLIFGIGNTSKIAPIVFACSFYLLINTIYGVKNVKESRIKVGKIWKMSKREMFFHILLPESLPYIAAGLRSTISLSLILAIVFEMFAGTRYGIGQGIIDFQLLYKIPEMYVFILLSGILGYVLNKLFLVLENNTIHWSGK